MSEPWWRMIWGRWHYFTSEGSVCEKFGYQVISGARTRRARKGTLTEKDREWPICNVCESGSEAADV